jgi:pimeloyl-ACP methyl ester carboxylesterase
MTILDVPGARLYYETHGSGPLFVMIPGASGTADPFRAVAGHLAAQYTVARYDRRGFSRSRLDGPPDDDRRLGTDADDVRRLIEHLGDGPATVFGTSSGAVVALEVLARHPAAVRTLIAFEPCAVRQLPEGRQWLDFFGEIYDLYRNAGAGPALARFREQAFAAYDRPVMAHATERHIAEHGDANTVLWFEHELRQYPAANLDIDALTAHADRMLLAVGRESRGYPCYEVTWELGRKLGRDVAELPGGHLGCMTHSVEFATQLVRALAPDRTPSR